MLILRTVAKGTCRFLTHLNKTVICVPVKGQMTVFFIGNNEDVVKDYLLYHLSVEMNSQRVLIGTIMQTFFIGETESRNSPPVSQIESTTSGQVATPENSESDNFLPIIMGIPIGFCVLAFLSFFVVRRRRTRQQKEHVRQVVHPQNVDEENDEVSDARSSVAVATELPPDWERKNHLMSTTGAIDEVPSIASDADDVEQGSRDVSDPVVVVQEEDVFSEILQTISNISSDGAEPISTDATNADIKLSEVAESSVSPNLLLIDLGDMHTSSILQSESSESEEPSQPNEQSVSNEQREQIESKEQNVFKEYNLSRELGTVESATGQPLLVVDLLPPLPPGGPSAKTAAAKAVPRTVKRRRRKKKKKQPRNRSLTRVNSRDSVKEMETIAEAPMERGSDEDESSYEYGSGSEYSWSTDGSDSRPGSRDPSPVRASSQSPHRTGRSASPGLPPIHRAGRSPSPRPTDSDIVSNPSTDSDRGTLPAPILEEPKVKPLPPPWV